MDNSTNSDESGPGNNSNEHGDSTLSRDPGLKPHLRYNLMSYSGHSSSWDKENNTGN